VKKVADVLVVGGGIVGASCAAALAARGCRVRVLDAGLPGASAAGMGHLVVMDDDPAELTLSARSLALWRGLVPSCQAPRTTATAAPSGWPAMLPNSISSNRNASAWTPWGLPTSR